MAFDENLAARVREELEGVPGIDERRMLGGLMFMRNGNMAVGIHQASLIVRVGPAASEEALKRPGARVFDLTGKPMKAWVLVTAGAVTGERELKDWIQRGLAFADSLPAR